MTFTQTFIKRNIYNNVENIIEIVDYTLIDNITDITSDFDIEELNNIFNNEELEIHWLLDNDNKYIEICLNTNVDFIYWFTINFEPNFDIKQMLDVFLSKIEQNAQIDLIEDNNRQILKIGGK